LDTRNYLKIKENLPKNVNLLAVSKGFRVDQIKQIYELGQKDFGESKFQEAYEKQSFLNDIKNIRWHFLGNIQSNKIRKIVKNFDYIHSVDSYKKLIKISSAAAEIGKTQKIMIQLKLANDPQKGGMDSDEILSKWGEIQKISNLKLMGLMTINPKGLSSEENFQLFSKCREIADSLKLVDCSMGMSNDWKEAISAGSTWLRLGSVLFGERFNSKNINNKE